MSTITFTPSKVRLANTHNALTRTRPLGGSASIGDVAQFDADGNWVKRTGSSHGWGVIIGIRNGGMPLEDGDEGDDAEVLMEGIVAGYDVDPNEVAYDAGDGTLGTTGITAIGIGMNDGLLYVRPEMSSDLVS